MKTIMKALFLLVALTATVSVFAQSDFESQKARAEAGDAEAQDQPVIWYATNDILTARGESITLGDRVKDINAGSVWSCSIGETSKQLPSYEAKQTACSFEDLSVSFSVQCDSSNLEDHTQIRFKNNQQTNGGFIEVGCRFSDVPNATILQTSNFQEMLSKAQSGDSAAQRNLGEMYRDGSEVALDDRESLKWFISSAELGDVRAQLSLGEMYDIGLAVDEDDQEAVKWYRAAASQGNSRAQYMLGIKDESGSGTPQNYSKAYVWLSVSAAQGEEFAAETRDRVGVLLSPQALEQAQAQATRCFESNFKECE